MSLPVFTDPASTLLSNFLCLFSLFILLFHGVPISGRDDTINIGAIINLDSRVGKEERLSMDIAVNKFNAASSNRKLQLLVKDSGGDPLKAYTA
ncbi:Glutamate receptor, partial [Thalictrum thalictroides]